MDPDNKPVQSNPSGLKSKLNFKNKNTKLAAIIIGAVVLLGGASAGAYYGIVVPNQPQNVLKKSAENLLNAEQISGKGKASFSTEGDSAGTGTVEYSIQTDSTKNALAGTFDISLSGVKIPVEARVVDKAAYVKLGDLSSIESLAAASLGAESAPIISQLSSKISDKWIEFDESFLKTATQNKCSILTDQQKISEDQINQILDIYGKNMFVTVKNESSDTVNGQKAAKYELGLDQNKAKEFGKEVGNLDYFKKIKECGGSAASTEESSVEDFKGDATFTVWVDKSKKQFVKMQLTTKEDKSSVDADFTFNNDAVNITKPEGAIPAVQLYSELISLLSGGVAVPQTSPASSPFDFSTDDL